MFFIIFDEIFFNISPSLVVNAVQNVKIVLEMV